VKAAVLDRYGSPDVVRVDEVDTPSVKPGQVLVRVRVSTVNRTDCAARSASPFVWRLILGPLRPRQPVLGCEYAGEVVAVADDVTDFRTGDRVFGFGDAAFGGHGEYAAVKADSMIATIPENLDYEQAAAGTEGSHYALTMIRGARVRAGQKVLVHGATGAIGSAAVQLLHGLGVEVTAVCDTRTVRPGPPHNAPDSQSVPQLLRDLGADLVLDQAAGEFDGHVGEYDVVVDAVGRSTFGRCRRLLRPGGVYLSSELGPGAQNLVLAALTPLLRGRRVLFPFPRADRAMAEQLSDLMREGSFRPVIDRSFTLAQIVEAYHYVEQGRKLGNVVLVVRDPESD